MRFAGTVPVGLDYPAIAALAAALGCPPTLTAYFFPSVEVSLLSALHDKLKDRS